MNLKSVLQVLVFLFYVNFSFGQQLYDTIQWTKVIDPDLILQLENTAVLERHDWDTLKANVLYTKNNCSYIVQNKTNDYTDAVHRFTITSASNAKRSEMKIEFDDKYKGDGIYQMEGELQYIKGINSSNHVCQIWQNMTKTGSKILIFNTYSDNNGTLRVPSSSDRVGTFKSLTNVYANYTDEANQWLKINVVHFRAQRRVLIYLNGVLYNDYINGVGDGDYYFKFGAYGREGHLDNLEATVQWRKIKFFVGERGNGVPTPPAAPTNLVATAISTSQINLGWKDNASDETAFELEQSTDSVTFVKIASPVANNISFSKTGLSENVKYFYRIKAVNASGSSGYSNVAVARTKSSPTGFIGINDGDALLLQVMPNPAKGNSKIIYTLAQRVQVQISIHNLAGKKLAVLANESQDAGKHEKSFDTSDLAKGMYIVKLAVGNDVKVIKLVVE